MSDKISGSFNNNHNTVINIKNEILHENLQEMINLQSSDMLLVKEYLLKISTQIESTLSIEELEAQIENLQEQNDRLKTQLFLSQKNLEKITEMHTNIVLELKNCKKDMTNE